MNTFLDRFADPRFVVSLVVLGIFAWAFGENVSDDTMKGAIIGALNVVAGYWLGSSNSSSAIRDQMGKALDLATNAQPTPPQPDVILRPGETAQAEEPRE